ncbi:hypothetical protein [Alcanivorax sediminis]|uniref:Uncharacterized protein n=1 Tax=Alcanivorax sediminis TaxID=2663008 RepID=A0A6N7LRG0_9GAMM|nr:hypothetical protein [Alcanivorax sediminis]MQX52978.1 hypothetical protein [Alcanivorax sediminis]
MNKLIGIFLVLALTGCARESLRGDHGYSNENNMAVQVVNPGAENKDYGVITTHGAKINAGVERYLKDDGEVEEGRVVEDVGG